MKKIFWEAFIRARFLLHPYQGVKLGEAIPDFTLRDLKGRPYTLSSYLLQKSVVLWFTNLCSTCQERIGFLQDIYQSNREHLEVLAISTLGADQSAPERVLRDHRFDFPLLLDPADWLGKTLGLAHPGGACPMYNVLILDKKGGATFKHHLSAVSDEKFLEAVKASVL